MVKVDLGKLDTERVNENTKNIDKLSTLDMIKLINKEDKNDPIRKMAIPSEFEKDLEGTFDTSGEGDNTVITGM